jgi:hypothetical protein
VFIACRRRREWLKLSCDGDARKQRDLIGDAQIAPAACGTKTGEAARVDPDQSSPVDTCLLKFTPMPGGGP